MRDFWQMTRVWAVLAIVGLLAALAAACGDGGEPQAEGSPTPSPTGEDVCEALQALKSYRYSFDLKIESPEPSETPTGSPPTPTGTITRDFGGPFSFEYAIEASFVAPDRIEASITTDSGEPVIMIAIGDQVWTQFAGSWRQLGQPISQRPPVICEAVLPDLDLLQTEPQEEKVNDVKTLHYTFSQVHSEQAWAKLHGSGSDLDILLKKLDVDLWLAEKDNWPVRMEIHSTGFYGDGRELSAHLLLDIRDANNDDIRVEPPF